MSKPSAFATLLDWARSTTPLRLGGQAECVANLLIDLLAEAEPCGWEAPFVFAMRGGGKVKIPGSWGAAMPPEDARACARMLLRAADEAERK